MTNEELKAIERRAKKATAGPWKTAGSHVFAPGPDGANVCSMSEPRASNYAEYTRPETLSKALGEIYANAEFVAHSREDIPALLAEIRRLRKPQGKKARAVMLPDGGRTPAIFDEDYMPEM